MGYETAAQIINDAATELGLIQADVTDPFGSSDENLLLLCRLLTSVGRTLVNEHRWQQLTQTYTFNTVAGTSTYNLPSDFSRMIDQTYWNRTTRLPLVPAEAQAWEYAQAVQIANPLLVMFRPMQGKLQMYPTPTAANAIAFEYESTYWVQASGSSVGTASRSTVYTDTILLDPTLVMYGLKVAYLRNKGYDSTAALEDFVNRLNVVKQNDSPAPRLSLNRRSYNSPLLDERNIPITGYGSGS